ncbi:hypothetical protein JI735_33745 (plasmid) [Paenibacillus sonchi]|uniref:Uncharacterized protein n=1 Tax=Paenibacillus sonchi TaxID=373687 RepID=A0A974SGP9_9BACL|nr:hypothetical protein [Paenibacillus sonchi]QQZ64616.1 hypothetical protein JI735_33745 [Paenibacillus sonchi]
MERERLMILRTIGFKCFVDAPIEEIGPVLKKIKFHSGKKDMWSRSIGAHTLQISPRITMCSAERSFFWVHFFREGASVEKNALDRVLADWYFTMSKHFVTVVNWMQAAVEVDPFSSIYGYTENTPRIWSKVDKQLRFSFYPVRQSYLLDVRNDDIRIAIPHHRYSLWLDDLEHNVQGHKKPDDQISLDLII